MNESIRLVIKLLFFNIGLPVLSVSFNTDGNNPDLSNVQVQSSVEYLSEYGDVVVKRISSPQTLAVNVYEDPNTLDDQWYYDFNMEELIENRSGGHRAGKGHISRDVRAPDRSVLMAPPPAEPGEVAKTENIAESIGEVAGNEANKNEVGDNTQKKSDMTRYNITLSRSNYFLFKILKLFNIKNAALKYEYTELDYIPVILQVLLHIPLILTGVIIFIVLMTLDPELNANLIKNEIEKLPSTTYTKDMELSSCPVCLDEFVEEQEVRILGCRHGFHKECIDAWLIHTLKCPICRKSVSSMSDAPQFEMYQTYYYV